MERALAVRRLRDPLPICALVSRPQSRPASTRDVRALFERLFADYRTPILNYLYRLLGNAALAEDLAQETFARAWQARSKLPDLENPRAWLYRIATNAARDHHRRARLIAWLPLRARDPELQHDEAGVAGDPVESQHMRMALLHLSPDYRVPLVLYVCEEFSVAEIAEALSISRAAVKQRLARARERLRRAFESLDAPADCP
jgi:RNA polymerase sigma-70 factor (ECF subfamily)